MTTTAIFAELLVAGLEAVVWLTVLILAFTGPSSLSKFGTFQAWAAAPITVALVGLSYALGVIVDRLADSLLRKFDRSFRRDTFGDEDFPIGRTRVIAAFKSPELANYLGYIRSRMRIARALTFNLVFTTIATALYAARQTRVPWWIVLAIGAVLVFGTGYAWRRISTTFYRRLRQVRSILFVDFATLFEGADDAMAVTGEPHWCIHLLGLTGTKVYLQRRSGARARNPGAWTSTVSGHVSGADPLRKKFDAMLGGALQRETREELGLVLDTRKARRLGEITVASRGGGEVCIGRTAVYSMDVAELPTVVTTEVNELCAFERAEIAAALAAGRGLRGSDGAEHPFADNFKPVFDLLRSR